MITHYWPRVDSETRIAGHVHAHGHSGRTLEASHAETLPFITVNRDFGCEALAVSKKLADYLNQRYQPTIPWAAYDRELLDRVAGELHLRREIVETVDGAHRSAMKGLFDTLLNNSVDEVVIFRRLAEVVRSLAIHGHSIIVGRGSHLLTKGLRTGLHVRLVAPRDWRIKQIATSRRVSLSAAKRIVAEGEKDRLHFLQTHFVNDPERPFSYDVVIDVARFSPVEAVQIISAAVLTPRFGDPSTHR